MNFDKLIAPVMYLATMGHVFTVGMWTAALIVGTKPADVAICFILFGVSVATACSYATVFYYKRYNL